jgi:hypothetical protein
MNKFSEFVNTKAVEAHRVVRRRSCHIVYRVGLTDGGEVVGLTCPPVCLCLHEDSRHSLVSEAEWSWKDHVNCKVQ